jgi:DNA-binding protein HU-beta
MQNHFPPGNCGFVTTDRQVLSMAEAFRLGRAKQNPVFMQHWLIRRLQTPCGSKSRSLIAMAKKPGTPATVTLKHIAANLAEEHEVPKKQAEAILGDMVSLLVKHLKKGDRIRLVGLGIFQVRKRAARMGRNPATGEAIKIKASKKVAFRAAKELKEAI